METREKKVIKVAKTSRQTLTLQPITVGPIQTTVDCCIFLLIFFRLRYANTKF